MTATPVTLRLCQPADLPAVRALVVAVLAEFGFSSLGGIGGIGGVERDLADIATRYAAPAGGFWVADEAGRVVGTVAVRPRDGRTCELKRLYLVPERRGTGLGQRLYQHAEAFARAAGYDTVWLDSSRRFLGAHRLYQRNGFRLVERLDNEWEDDVYEKRLL